MKRTDKKTICAIVVLLVLFALLQLLCALSVQAIERNLPHAASLYNPRGVGITMKQALSTEYNPSVGDNQSVIIGAMSAEQRQTVSVSGIGASEAAYAAYATPVSGLALPFRYTYGNWFLPDENNMASNAVIPESLSLSLFGTDKPVGNSIIVGQTEFRICGVYREEKGFLQKISGDGIPRVYLYNPLRMAELPVSVLYLSDAANSDVQFLKQQSSSIHKTALNGEIVDYRQQIQLAHSLWYLSVLLCVFFPVILLITFAGLQFVRLHAGQNEPIIKRLKRLLIGMCITAITLILLMLLLNQLRIPQTYLSQDNIFDFAFYKKSMVSFFTSLHIAGGASRFEWVFVTHLLALLFWAMSGIVFFYAGVLKLRYYLKELYKSKLSVR